MECIRRLSLNITAYAHISLEILERGATSLHDSKRLKSRKTPEKQLFEVKL